MLEKASWKLAALLLLAVAAGPASAHAIQDEGGGESSGESAEREPEADRSEWLILTGGDVYTGTGAVLRGATLISKNGRIAEIGYDLEIPGRDYWADVPEDQRWFKVRHQDVSGYRIYPGLVAINSSSLLGASGSFEDQADPFNQSLILGLASGITSTGQGTSAIKLKRYVRSDPPKPFDFDKIELSKRTYTSLASSGASARRQLRERLDIAARYLRKYRQWEEDVKKDKELKEPSKRGVDSSILAVLKGEAMARFRANESEELLWIARLAQEYGFRPQIEGCREGWVVADELGRAGTMAIVVPRDRRDKSEELQRPGGSSIENAAILHRSGVQVAIRPASTGINLGGIVGRDIMHIPMEVGFAIRGGLPEDAALASITTIPARMMGISHRVGTIEVGKDCDLIVTDGDLLHYQTFVQWAIVDGEIVYDKQEELYFTHIRPRPDTELAPESKLDPGELPVEPAAAEPEGSDGEEQEVDEEQEVESPPDPPEEEEAGGDQEG
jgi:imidazolonepropionase-like amidohydrolase